MFSQVDSTDVVRHYSAWERKSTISVKILSLRYQQKIGIPCMETKLNK